jgi:titin
LHPARYRSPRASRSRTYRPCLETLEDRWLLTAVTVTSAADDGSPGTLRAAIAFLNQNPGANDRITFAIPGGATTILLNSALPPIIDSMTIDATTQSGFSNGVPAVTLDGGLTGAVAGFDVIGGNTTILGFAVVGFGFGSGIQLEGPGNDVVRDNYLGIEPDGITPAGNQLGLEITSGSGDIIGGVNLHDGNLLSGNFASGLSVFTSNNLIEGNFIGTDVAGTVSVANLSTGASIAGRSNTIGGAAPGAGNVISGNIGTGLAISSDSNLVQGNRVGTDVGGMAPLGNVGDGLAASGNTNTIGGTVAGAGNVIAGNGGNGIRSFGQGTVVEGNFIGTDATGTAALPNLVGVSLFGSNTLLGGTTPLTRNVISGNTADGIEIIGFGSNNNRVTGDYIGTNAAGTQALPNGGSGVSVAGGATGNVIGGTSAPAGNLISSNRANGVLISGPGTNGNLVQGSFIGTDVTGTRALGNQGNGIYIFDEAAGNLIGGTVAGAGNVVSGNRGMGIAIDHEAATTGNLVQGNWIGTDLHGTVALANQAGVAVEGGAHGNTIGGAVAAARNVISGNMTEGVVIIDRDTKFNLVQGNFVGTDATGTAALPNGNGIILQAGAANNSVFGNLISGNLRLGVGLLGNQTSLNVIAGNYIGTDVTGTVALGNLIGVSDSVSANGNIIGGETPARANVISGNSRDGVIVSGPTTIDNRIEGNLIGTDATGMAALSNGANGVDIFQAGRNTVGGTSAGAGNVIAYNGADGVRIDYRTGNAIRANSIYASTGLGIDLFNHGNHDQPAPVILSVQSTPSDVTIQGAYTAMPDISFALDFFASPVCNPAGFGDGQEYLGSLNVLTDPTGTTSFQALFPVAVPSGQVITATATNNNPNQTDTSEFSVCFSVPSSNNPARPSPGLSGGLPGGTAPALRQSLAGPPSPSGVAFVPGTWDPDFAPDQLRHAQVFAGDSPLVLPEVVVPACLLDLEPDWSGSL